MNDSSQSSSFPSTCWTWIVQVRGADVAVRRHALNELLKIYFPALKTYLIRTCRLDAEFAEEIAQGFVVEKVLERDLFAAADPARGRLRSLMLRSLKNYLIDRLRQTGKQVPWPDESSRLPSDCGALPQDAYDVVWARQVLSESLRRMRDDCHVQKRPQVWALFEARVVHPTLNGTPPVEYATLVPQFGFGSPEQASNILINAKRQFRQVLKAVVAEYAVDEEVESELNDLRAIVAAAGPLEVALPGAACEESFHQRLEEAAESHPSFWSVLFDEQAERDSLWSDEELRQLLEHQLRLPLRAILDDFDPPSAKLDAGQTLGELLTHASPPLELLDATKRWARAAIRDDSSNLPTEITSLLYFSTIAAAMLRHNVRMTKSDDETLRYGFARMVAKPFAPEPICVMLRAAMAQVVGRDDV